MKTIGPIQHRGKWGYVTPSGDWAIEPQFELLGQMREGLAGFLRACRLGFINETGEIVVDPQFRLSHPVIWGFRDGLAPVTTHCDKFIDRNGSVVLELPAGGQGRHFVDGKAVFMDRSGSYSVLNNLGGVVATLPIDEAPFLPDWPEDWDCFTCWCGTDQRRVAAVDWTGEFVFRPRYSEMTDFFEGVAGFCDCNDGRERVYGLVKRTGEVLWQPAFYEMGNFKEGLARAGRTLKEFGFINPNGEWVIEPKFRQAQPFSDGLACVTVNDNTRRGKKGFIDRTGEMIIEPRFDREASFHQGFAQVEYEGKHAVIEKSGRVIWEAEVQSS